MTVTLLNMLNGYFGTKNLQADVSLLPNPPQGIYVAFWSPAYAGASIEAEDILQIAKKTFPSFIEQDVMTGIELTAIFPEIKNPKSLSEYKGILVIYKPLRFPGIRIITGVQELEEQPRESYFQFVTAFHTSLVDKVQASLAGH